MNIRIAEIKDAGAISAGEYDVAKTPGLLVALPGEIPKPAFSDKISAIKASSSGLYIVIENENVVTGHLLLDPMQMSAMAHVCSLTIVVYPNWQGLGLGRTLMEYAIDWAMSVPIVEKIELMVRATNQRAISLYRSFGFEEEGRIRKSVKIYTGVDSIYVDNVLMGRFVDSDSLSRKVPL